MLNSTQFSYFTLSVYFNVGLLKYLFFLIVLCFYIITVCINMTLIVVVCMNRTLHETMYMFLCSLLITELLGCTTLFPMILVQLLQDVHIISPSICLLQIFFVHTYATVEYLTLAVMSYDRYVAICRPLQYHSHMSATRSTALIAGPWVFGLAFVLITVSVTTSQELCGNVVEKVYCDNYSVIRMACSKATVYMWNIYGLILHSTTISFPLVFMLFSYIRILQVCLSGSKQTRQKAVNTCTPHLASLLNFTIGGSFEIIQSRFDMTSVPTIIRILLSLYLFLIQPLLNPLMYGLNISKIRILCKSLLLARVRTRA